MKLYNWRDVDVQQLDNGITRQMITAGNMMLAQIFVPKGVSFPAHKISSEQITIYVKGGAVYQSEHGKTEAREGDILYIPAGTEHRDEVTEDTIVLDVFSPPRKDWLKK